MDLYNEFFYGSLSYSRDIDVPLAYENNDGTTENISTVRVMIMSDHLLKDVPYDISEGASTEFTVREIRVKCVNYEHYFERRYRGIPYDLLHTDEIVPHIRGVLDALDKEAPYSIKNIMKYKQNAVVTWGDVTYD